MMIHQEGLVVGRNPPDGWQPYIRKILEVKAIKYLEPGGVC